MINSIPGSSDFKILIVDDDNGVLRLLTKVLNQQGFSSISAISGHEAMNKLGKTQIDLMLLDLKLQDIDAKEFVDRLASEGRSVPFVIITGQGDERAAVEMMKRGAMDYLVKNGQFLDLVPTVVRLALEQIQKDKQLAQLRQNLAEKVVELEGFSYSVSHDMRAPLRAMQGFASYLLEEYGGKLDEQGVYYLQQIMRSSARLDRLIQDILSYSKILHAKIPIGPVDLDRLVKDLVAIYLAGTGVKPQINIMGQLPTVMGNEALLTQCISNLLENAIKFVSPGTTPVIQISAKPMGDSSLRINIKDNGIGIAPENQSRIFRLFEKVHSAEDYEGTGLGLCIVAKACQRMNAQVGVESELGKGTLFWMELKKA